MTTGARARQAPRGQSRAGAPSPAEAVGRALDTVFETAADLADSARVYLGSEEGRRLRETVARAVIVGAPVITQLPVIRRNPFARLVGAAAMATLLVKGAEWLRDWEPVAVEVRDWR